MKLPPLPKLPESSVFVQYGAGHYFSADALRTYAEEYGRLCAEAEREACAAHCDALSKLFAYERSGFDKGYSMGTSRAASEIRARSTA